MTMMEKNSENITLPCMELVVLHIVPWLFRQRVILSA